MNLEPLDKELYDSSLVLKVDSKDFIYKYIENSNMRTIYKKSKNKIFLFLLKLFNKFLIPGYSFFFGNWKMELKKKNIKNIIIFDSGYKTSILKYIKKKNKDCKVIVFCWNILNDQSIILKDRELIDEIYSFDPNDVEKYGLKFNNSFYTEDLKLPTIEVKNELFFLGQNKGRENRIDEFKKICGNQNIKYNFIIPQNKNEFVDYDTYLNLLNQSKAVLDFTQEGQTGLTVRAMECLFLKKKLVTDNALIKNYSFYNKSNIFIVNEDKIEDLRKFIDEPYIDVSYNILKEYDYKNWCVRMLKN